MSTWTLAQASPTFIFQSMHWSENHKFNNRTTIPMILYLQSSLIHTPHPLSLSRGGPLSFFKSVKCLQNERELPSGWPSSAAGRCRLLLFSLSVYECSCGIKKKKLVCFLLFAMNSVVLVFSHLWGLQTVEKNSGQKQHVKVLEFVSFCSKTIRLASLAASQICLWLGFGILI